MRPLAESSLALILFLAAVAPAAAQSTGGTLDVHVADDSGAIIPGAEISLIGPAGFAGTTAADAQGKYAFQNLAPGAYKARVSWPGFAVAESPEVLVTSGQTATLNISLHIQVSQDKVTVEAEGPRGLSTDPGSNAGALILTGADLDTLPDDPDDLAADLKALAGPSAGLGDVQMFIDGFSGGHLPSKESIREIRINQNPFSAEDDRVGFGRVEILPSQALIIFMAWGPGSSATIRSIPETHTHPSSLPI
jgi:hypothetical protein